MLKNPLQTFFLLLFSFVIISIFSNYLFLIIKIEETEQLIFKSILRLCYITVLVVLVKKWDFVKLEFKNNIFFLFLILIILYLITNYVNTKLLQNGTDSYSIKNIVFFIFCFTVGVFEELFFRVILFYTFLKFVFKTENIILKSIFATSFVFAIVHFTNFFNPDYEKLGVLNQMLFAFGIGYLFQSIYIRFNNFLFIAALHGFTNYIGSYSYYLITSINKSTDTETSIFDSFISFFMFLLIIVLIVLPISYSLIKKVIKKPL